MRNSTHFVSLQSDANQEAEKAIWSLSGAFIGFLSWLIVLCIPFLTQGLNTFFFFLYTWPFFLGLLPVAIVIGVALYSVLTGRLLLCCIATLFIVALAFCILFLWLTL